MFAFSSRLGEITVSITSTLLSALILASGVSVDVLTVPLGVFIPKSKLMAVRSGDSDLIDLSPSNELVDKSAAAAAGVVVLVVVLAEAAIFSKTL